MRTKLARPSSHGSFRPYRVVPVVGAFLSAMMLGVFFCFLPIAPYIVASAQVVGQKQVHDLQRRIEHLEAQATSPSA